MVSNRSPLPRLWAVLALVVLAGPVLAEVAIPPSLKIEEGEAQLKAPGDDQAWRRARAGQVVDFGLVVSTDRNFQGSIVYPDGTALTLKPATMLQVLSDGLRLYRGQAWIKVTKRGRAFTCVMPSAIASVRGTRFSCEVPSYSKLFGQAYVSEFFHRSVLNQGMRGHLMATGIGLGLLARLIAQAPAGKVPSAVKVFEGKVLVSVPARSGAIQQSWMVTPGEKVDTGREHASKEPLTGADYAYWSLPVPAGLGPLAPGAAPTASGDDLPGVSNRDATPAGAWRLLDEMHERR